MPERPVLVITNTTPIITLALIDHLDILQQLYGNILIPPAVRDEVLAGGIRNIGISQFQAANWIKLTPLQDPRRADLLSDLDRGEAEVIALAQELQADRVIIDERLARRHARRLGLTLTGTLGILLKARQQKLVPEIAPLIRIMQQNGIWLSATVIAEVLRLAGEK